MPIFYVCFLLLVMAIDHCKVESLIAPIAYAMGYTVWHIELRGIGRKTLLRVYVDVVSDGSNSSNKSIGVDDCGRISNQISAVFAVEEPILGSYVLEVSSPGLERSLFKIEHYTRYIGSMVRIVLRQPVDMGRDFTGKILKTAGSAVTLEVNKQPHVFEITDINRAKIILDL